RGSFPGGCTRGWSDRQRRSGRTCLPSGLLRSVRSRPRRQQRRGRLSRACRAVGAVGRLSLVAMAKTYRLNLGTRLVNALFRAVTRLGRGARYRSILVVPGRKTGRLYSTPVDVIRADGERWLVAGYGPASWVANARAAGEVTLRRGRRTQRLGVEEETAPAAVGVLREYMRT